MAFVPQIGSSNPFNGIDVGYNSAPTLADIDGDGDLDAVVGEFYGTLRYYKNMGSATNPQYTQQTSSNPFNGIDVGLFSKGGFADIDGDGDLDAVVGERYGTLRYYKNTGSATNPQYTQQTSSSNPFNGIDVGWYSKPTFADIDGDGDLDAVVGEDYGTLLYYKNTGSATNPQYAPQTDSSNPFNGIDVDFKSVPTLADIDGDGDLDAVVGENNGTLLYYKNTGSATNPQYTQQTDSSNPFNGIDVGYNSAPTLADIDGDGDLDAVVGENYGTLLYYINNQPPVIRINPGGSASASVTETNAGLTANGTLTLTDPDVKDVVTVAVSSLTASGNTTGLVPNNATLLTYLTLPSVVDTNTTTGSQFTWNFNSGTEAFNYLAVGQTLTLTYVITANDGLGGTNTQDITITINGANDVATITGTATASVTEDDSNPNLTAIGTLNVNDVDAGQNQFSTIVTSTAGNLGSLSITNTGTYTYTVANSDVQYLNTAQSKTETFTVSSIDGTANQVINITINGVSNDNLPPVANPDTATVVEGQSIVIPILANDTDPDIGDILAINSFTNPSNGTVTQNTDGTFTYKANLNFSGADSFSYTIKDTAGAISNAATVSLSINPLNLEGSSANDNLLGTASANIINGNAGDDYLEGKAGNDTINGGLGNLDLMFGGGDNDTITDPDGILGAHGGTGNDTITVTFAATWDNDNNPSTAPRSDGKITGGYGDDSITVTMNKSGFFLNMKGDEPVSNTPQDGNDTVTLLGTYGNAVVDLGGGNDTFTGGAASDNVSGGNDNDSLFGLGGNDQLTGGSGNDTLRGGLGNDQLIGGTGADVFVFTSGEGRDTITDFQDGTDLVGLSSLSFGQLTVVASGSNTLIRLTSNNELLATLNGVNSSLLTSADFILI
ncbi:VCBS domain-containing protein [Nostoc sp.]|uniref:VCBS domain-containing protein n=1 Tax=Nostoc sp. TaxID=1180 RepID=UPI002FF9D219